MMGPLMAGPPPGHNHTSTCLPSHGGSLRGAPPNSRMSMSGPPIVHSPPMDTLSDQFSDLRLNLDLDKRRRDDPDDRSLLTEGERSTYEGWTFYRANRPGESPSWIHVTRCRMHLPQDELARLAQKRKKTIAQIYSSMSRLRRQHIDKLIEDRKRHEQDPRFDWTCVYISSVLKELPRRNLFMAEFETTSMNIVLKRHLKPGISRSPRHGKSEMGPHPETLDLSSPSQFDDGKRRHSLALDPRSLAAPPPGPMERNPPLAEIPHGGPQREQVSMASQNRKVNQSNAFPPAPPHHPPQGGMPLPHAVGPPVNTFPPHGIPPPPPTTMHGALHQPPPQHPHQTSPPPPPAPPAPPQQHHQQHPFPQQPPFQHNHQRPPPQRGPQHGPPQHPPQLPPQHPAPPPQQGPLPFKDMTKQSQPSHTQQREDMKSSKEKQKLKKLAPKVINSREKVPKGRPAYDTFSDPESSVGDDDSMRFDEDGDTSATEDLFTPDDYKRGRASRPRSYAPLRHHSRSFSRPPESQKIYPGAVVERRRRGEHRYPREIVDVIPARTTHRPHLTRSQSLAHPSRSHPKSYYDEDVLPYRGAASPTSTYYISPSLSPSSSRYSIESPFVDDLIREREFRSEYLRSKRLQEKEAELNQRELDLLYREIRAERSGRLSRLEVPPRQRSTRLGHWEPYDMDPIVERSRSVRPRLGHHFSTY
ncbi:hypothetical protein VTO42DRAFT_8571 [Malbranchea cinnamomea]